MKAWIARLVVLFLASAVGAAEVKVEQGTVGRWPDAESCGMDGRTWKALDGVCYYPIDFERAPGKVEIARWPAGGSMETAWLTIVAKDWGQQDIELPDDRFVHLSDEDLARHYREQAEIKPRLRRRGGEAKFHLPLGKPAEPLPEGSGFGVRRTFNGEPKNAHTGSDYAISLGTPVLAVADGEVLLTGEHFFAGNSVYLYHGDGLVTMYFHLDSIDAEDGGTVAKGATVGTVGSTGRSTGPHLHLGVRWRGARIDPAVLLADPSSMPTVTP